MGTVYQQLLPEEAILRTTAFARYVKANGSNYPVTGLAFAATDNANEQAFWRFRAAGYGSGSLTIAIDWYADTASSGDVVWDAQLAAITPDNDAQDIETDGLATENTVTDSHLGTTGQRVHRAVITLSNLDGLAADDIVTLCLRRDTAAGNADTMAGDAIVTNVTVSYSDT
jgi:hypothetical protein